MVIFITHNENAYTPVLKQKCLNFCIFPAINAAFMHDKILKVIYINRINEYKAKKTD